MPGLAEELVFRGLLLALCDRAACTRRRIFGAELGGLIGRGADDTL